MTTCSHSINLEDSCGHCDSQTILELRARVERMREAIGNVFLVGAYLGESPTSYQTGRREALEEVRNILKQALKD